MTTERRPATDRASIVRQADASVIEMPFGRIEWQASDGLGNCPTMTIGRCILKPGAANPMHRHPNCWEVLTVISGRILHTIGADKDGDMAPGDSVVIPPGLPHRARNAGSETAVLHIAFSTGNREVIGEAELSSGTSQPSADMAITTPPVAIESDSALRERLIGTWRMIAWKRRLIPSGEEDDGLGPVPTGYLTYSADGRVMFLVVDGRRNRPAGPPSVPEQIALFETMMAYAATWTVEAGRVIHTVDASWNELWTGTKQVRQPRFTGNRLVYATPEAIDPRDGRLCIHTVTYERLAAPARDLA